MMMMRLNKARKRAGSVIAVLAALTLMVFSGISASASAFDWDDADTVTVDETVVESQNDALLTEGTLTVNKTDESTPDEDSSVPDEDSSVPDEDSSVPDEDSSVPDEDSSIPDEDSSVPDEDSSVPDEDSSVPDEDSSVPDEDSSVPDEDSSVPDEDSSIPDDPPPPEDESEPEDDSSEPPQGWKDDSSIPDEPPTNPPTDGNPHTGSGNTPNKGVSGTTASLFFMTMVIFGAAMLVAVKSTREEEKTVPEGISQASDDATKASDKNSRKGENLKSAMMTGNGGKRSSKSNKTSGGTHTGYYSGVGRKCPGRSPNGSKNKRRNGKKKKRR